MKCCSLLAVFFFQTIFLLAQDYRTTVYYPNLSLLDSGVHYVILDPETQLQKAQWGTQGFPGICSTPHPSCNIDTSRKWIYNKTWNTWILDEVRSNLSLKYILLKPGDYTPLGVFWIHQDLHPQGYVQFMYYNPDQPNPWEPSNRDTVDFKINAILSSFWLWQSERVVISGLMFWGDYETRDGTEGTSTSVVDIGSDSCIIDNFVLRNAITYGVLVRNSNDVFIQNGIVHDQKNPCSDAPGIMVLTFDNIPARRNRIVNNRVYNFCDAIQVAHYASQSGKDVNGLVIADNYLSQEAGFFYASNGQLYQRGENAIDVKISATSNHPDSVVRIKRNYIRSYYPPLRNACPSGETNSFVAVALGHANNLEFDSNIIDDVHVGVAVAYVTKNLKIRGNMFNNINRKATTHDPQQDGAAILLHVYENEVLVEGNIMRNCMRNIAFFNEQYAIDTTVINIRYNFFEGQLLHFYNNTSPPPKVINQYLRRNFLRRKDQSN